MENNSEEKLIVAKLNDKIKFCKTRNKIVNTEFLNMYQENILREIVFVKYQYDIMQRSMYELKMSYPDDIIDNINSSDKTTRLELQKTFLEIEYDRVTKSKFKSKEEIKFNLLYVLALIIINDIL